MPGGRERPRRIILPAGFGRASRRSVRCPSLADRDRIRVVGLGSAEADADGRRTEPRRGRDPLEDITLAETRVDLDEKDAAVRTPYADHVRVERSFAVGIR